MENTLSELVALLKSRPQSVEDASVAVKRETSDEIVSVRTISMTQLCSCAHHYNYGTIIL